VEMRSSGLENRALNLKLTKYFAENTSPPKILLRQKRKKEFFLNLKS
jgi:hypothetical protein